MGSNGAAAEYTYSRANMLSSVSVMGQDKITIEYDSQFNMKAFQDANGTITKYTYDDKGHQSGKSITRKTDEGTVVIVYW